MTRKILLLCLVALLGATTTFAKSLPIHKSNRDAFINSIFTPELFMQALIAYDIKNPEVVFAQAILESANFTSKIFRHNNNAVGMKFASKRKTTATGIRYKHAKYNNWLDMVKDIKLWQTQFFLKENPTQILTSEQYIKKLKTKKYATDRNYLAKVRKYLHQSCEIHREINLANSQPVLDPALQSS